jgi:alkanesulfonate monooxygenase SsuD/methylene tetrahydromethanopterin reductase-like flavin-dependent oxidoreductase (luciferase family)
MRIGLSLTSGYAVADHRLGAQWLIERARAGAAADLDLLSVGDHHATGPMPYYQGVPMLGRLLAEWTNKPAGCLFLLPLWHPLIVAEQVGTLASIHGGTFVVQTGVGGGAAQFAAMGKSLARRGGDIEESIRIIDALLRGEQVSSERYGMDNAQIAPTSPEPVEWWLGGIAPAALDRAARVSGILYTGPGSVEAAERNVRGFIAACDNVGREPVKMIMRQDVVIASTDELAEALAAPVLDRGYRGMGREAVAVGSPETVAAHFAGFRDLGYGEISARQLSIPQEAALESIALLAQVKELLAS